MPDDADPLEWGYERALARPARGARRLRRRTSTSGSASGAWSSSGAIDETLADLRARGVAFEEDGAVWLRVDRASATTRTGPLIKSDGEPTYLLPDIAYHRNKFARGFELLIDVWGADHHGYVARMRAAIQALGHDPAELEVLLGQMVRLERGGETVKLGKRSGELVELRDLVDEVGPDAARLTYLLQSIDSRQTIDLDLITRAVEGEPGLLRAVRQRPDPLASAARPPRRASSGRRSADVDLALLTHERELDLLRKLSELPEVVAAGLRRPGARTRSPPGCASWPTASTASTTTAT